jgi:VanZ family protein
MAARPIGSPLRLAYYWAPVLIMAGFIFATSSIPGKDIPPLFPHQDLLYHFSIYVILSLFFMRAVKHSGRRRTIIRLALYTVVFGFLYGASDELHQLCVPGRSCEVFDLITDTAGALMGAAAGGVYLKWRS